MTRASRHLLAAAVSVTVLAAGCGGGGDGGATDGEDGGSAAVTVEAFTFEPDPLAVAPGTTITFVNGDAIDHTVTAGTRDEPAPAVFDGDLPEEGSTFELSLDEPGTYPYFCEVHPGPGMTGTITVG